MKGKFADILKFVFFIFLFPLIVSSTVGFIRELNALPEELAQAFILGILVYLIIHLFVFKPQGVYQYGQDLVSGVFKFFAPVVEVASFLIPLYAFICMIALAIAVLGFHSAKTGWYCLLLTGLTLCMHLILTAETLGGKEKSVLKPNYFFAISLIYVINIFIVVVIFNLILKDFSFSNFFNTAMSLTGHVYKRVFTQLFVP